MCIAAKVKWQHPKDAESGHSVHDHEEGNHTHNNINDMSGWTIKHVDYTIIIRPRPRVAFVVADSTWLLPYS